MHVRFNGAYLHAALGSYTDDISILINDDDKEWLARVEAAKRAKEIENAREVRRALGEFRESEFGTDEGTPSSGGGALFDEPAVPTQKKRKSSGTLLKGVVIAKREKTAPGRAKTAIRPPSPQEPATPAAGSLLPASPRVTRPPNALAALANYSDSE